MSKLKTFTAEFTGIEARANADAFVLRNAVDVKSEISVDATQYCGALIQLVYLAAERKC